jgi:hypothetical protein
MTTEDMVGGTAAVAISEERRQLIVARIKADISEDADFGVLPEGPLTFSDLHGYVDANVYGGLCDDNADVSTDDLVIIQEEVERWLLSDSRNRPRERPWLGVARKVRPRDLEGGQWVYRSSPNFSHFGWFQITETRWLPQHHSRGAYLVRINRPNHLANLIGDHYYLSPAARETIREPLPTAAAGGSAQ